MKRTSWEFLYRVEEITVAAKGKVEYHNERLKWWTDKRTELTGKIKEEGLELNESVASTTTSSYSNSARPPSISIRNDLLADFNECTQRIEYHKSKVEEYNGWSMVLSAQEGIKVALNHDDWLYFYGKS